MATKKQKRAAALAKHEREMEELRQSGLRAQREATLMEKQQLQREMEAAERKKAQRRRKADDKMRLRRASQEAKRISEAAEA